MSNFSGFELKNGVLIKYTGEAADVVIPDDVTSIGSFAFGDCTGLTSVTIPESVTSIGEKAFFGCASLTSVIIPDSVLNIGECAFSSCLSLTSIEIPAGITEILEYTFSGCTSLTDVVIPDSVTKIHPYAFRWCKKLTTVTILGSATVIGSEAFSFCNSLKTINIPNGIGGVDEYSFKKCPAIKEMVLPHNVVGFEGTALEAVWKSFFETEQKVIMMNSLLQQLPDVVSNTPNIKTVLKNNKYDVFQLAIKNDNAEVVEKLFELFEKIELDELDYYIEKAEQTILLKAFLMNYKEYHYSVDEREQYSNDMIENTLGTKKISVEEWKKIFDFEKNEENNIRITGYNGFKTEVVIPEEIWNEQVKAIGERAFSPSAKRITEDVANTRGRITTVAIPEGVTEIGECAFSGCVDLTTVSIPDSVKSIGECAFSFCINLTGVTIPSGVTNIAGGAFAGCMDLNNVTVPDSVTYIGNEAFAGCINLTDITIKNGKTFIDSYVFAGDTKLTIHAPADSKAEKYAKENNINFVAE